MRRSSFIPFSALKWKIQNPGQFYLVSTAARVIFVDEVEYCSEVIRGKGRADGRITRPLHDPPLKEKQWWLRDGAAVGKYNPFFQSVLCGEVFPLLGIQLEHNFVNSASVWPWNIDIKGQNTAESLSSVMRLTPTMRTFFVNDWYDICTQIRILYYTLDYSDLPKDRTFIKGYEADHMAYLDKENTQAVTDDIYAFIRGEDPTK